MYGGHVTRVKEDETNPKKVESIYLGDYLVFTDVDPTLAPGAKAEIKALCQTLTNNVPETVTKVGINAWKYKSLIEKNRDFSTKCIILCE